MIQLLSDSLWPTVTRLAKTAGIAHVASAYVGRNAYRLLPLKQGSVLAVDFSDRAIRQGITNPHEILKFIRYGVEVHNVSNLHAKVFVFPKHAVVGSANVSTHSRDNLVEAAVEITDSAGVAAARDFVMSLRGDIIGPEYCKTKLLLYRPPKWESGHTKHSKIRRVKRRGDRSSIWLVPLVERSWDKVEKREVSKGRGRAKSCLKNTKDYRLAEFIWYGGYFMRVASIGDRVLQATETRNGIMLSRPAKVVHIRRFTNDALKELCVYLEMPSRTKRHNLTRITRKLGRDVRTIIRGALKSCEPAYVRKTDLVYRLESPWNEID